jgi:hypothetical protein
MANPPAPTELPSSGIGTVAQLVTAVNDRLRTIVSWVTGGYVGNPATSQVDLAQNQIINLADPVNPQDAVNLRTLKRIQPSAIAAPSAPTSVAPGSISFRLVYRGFAELSIEDVVVAAPATLDGIDFLAFAVDETDTALAGLIGVNLDAHAETDPINIVNSNGLVGGIATGPMGRLGRSVQVGDYLMIDAEIVRIVAVGTSSFTIKRRSGVAPSTAAQLGSTLAAHGAGASWYKLFPYPFTQEAKPQTFGLPMSVVPYGATKAQATGGAPPRWTLAAPNLCVVAIVALARSGSLACPPTIVNYSASRTPVVGILKFANSPGVRTFSGAAYQLGCSGTLTAGQFADFLVRVQAWHSIRNVWAYVMTATSPSANPLRAYLLYYDPSRTFGGIVQQFNFPQGGVISDATPPDGQQMPFGPGLQVWPPSGFAQIPMANGRAVWPFTGGGSPIQLAMDGWFDIVIDQADGASANLLGVVQV